MQALIELIVGIVAALASVALAQFGVEARDQRAPEREVRRINDECPPSKPKTVVLVAEVAKRDC